MGRLRLVSCGSSSRGTPCAGMAQVAGEPRVLAWLESRSFSSLDVTPAVTLMSRVEKVVRNFKSSRLVACSTCCICHVRGGSHGQSAVLTAQKRGGTVIALSLGQSAG